MEPIRLTAATNVITLQPEDMGRRSTDGFYRVKFDEGPYIILRISATASHGSYNWTHPNIVGKANALLDFKHETQSGGKYWTVSLGVNFYIVLPKTAFSLIPEHGYSYPQFAIGGETFSLNVSGGTNQGGWTDCVRRVSSTSCNLTKKKLNLLAAEAITVAQCREEGITLNLPEYDWLHREEEWNNLAASHDIALKPGMVVRLKGISYGGSDGPFPITSLDKRSYIIDVKPGRGRVGDKEINWTETAKLNNLLIRNWKHGAFNLIEPPAVAAAAV